MDIRPLVQGHTLVVPNVHYSSLGDVDQIHAGKIFLTGQKIGQAIRLSGLRCEGINLFMADGSAAGQTVFHSHLHVIPRYEDDGFSLNFPIGYGNQPARNELEQTASNIAAFIN